ncbi:MAG: RNA polymerase sigma factor [Terriglobia bacterium]
MATETSAEQLFDRIAAHNETALSELYDEFAPRLLGLVLRTFDSRDEAEDVLQSVFLQVWHEARVGLPAQASASAHLTQMARDAAISRRRASVQRQAASAGARRIRLEARWLPSAALVALAENRMELLSKVLRQLPARQCEVIERVVFEGLTEEEIATFRAEPLGRAQDELRAGLVFLRQWILTLVGTWTAGI